MGVHDVERLGGGDAADLGGLGPNEVRGGDTIACARWMRNTYR